jgi:HEPN domain-containing protein
MSDRDPGIWLQFARDDLGWAQASADAGYFSRACFAAQQAAEKALKAYLVDKAGHYPRIHALIEPLELAAKHDASLTSLKPNCAILDEYYLPVRYPLARAAQDFDVRESTAAISLAGEVLALAEHLI